MKVKFINNDAAGWSDPVEVPEGTTIQQLFNQKMSGSDPKNYKIRVNRVNCTADQVLLENDVVSITPTKVAGAGR